MGTAPDSSAYPRVLCLAPAYAPARPAVDEAAAALEAPAERDLAPVGDRIERVLRQLDLAGVRQVVICARAAGTARHGRLGDRTLLRCIGRTGPAAAVFPFVAARSLVLLARTANVVHLHHAADLTAPPLALVTARAWDIPLVISLHESHFSASPADPGARLRLEVARRLERAAARRAAAVIAPTRALAERLAAEGVPQRRIHVVSAELKEADVARQLLEIYRAVWARDMARRVAIWHPTPG